MKSSPERLRFQALQWPRSYRIMQPMTAKLLNAEILQRFITQQGLEHRQLDILDSVQPSVRLLPAPKAATPIGCSKIGGVPHLPPTLAWARVEDEAMVFVAQIDCAELAKYHSDPRLPKSGMLYFYYLDTLDLDPFEFWRWEVQYFDGESSALAPATPPAPHPTFTTLTPRRLHFRRELTIPDAESYWAFRAVSLVGSHWSQHDHTPRAYAHLLQAIRTLRGHSQHRILGHPDPITGDVYAEIEALHAREPFPISALYDNPDSTLPGWVTLLQLDDLDLELGIDGRLYYCIQNEPLLQGDFAASMCVVQTR